MNLTLGQLVGLISNRAWNGRLCHHFRLGVLCWKQIMTNSSMTPSTCTILGLYPCQQLVLDILHVSIWAPYPDHAPATIPSGHGFGIHRQYVRGLVIHTNATWGLPHFCSGDPMATSCYLTLSLFRIFIGTLTAQGEELAWEMQVTRD